MHLRLSSPSQSYDGSNFEENHTKVTMQSIKTQGASGGGHCQQYTSSWKKTKKLFLWSILLVQLGFILCFWLMQLGLSGRLNESSAGVTTGAGGDVGEDKRINFIKPQALVEEKRVASKVVTNFQWPSRDLKFQQDFVLQQNNYNLSEAEKQMFGDPSVWCFKEGTANVTRLSREEDPNQWPDNCHCLPEWHGQDCGQPEVIWRALMTAKLTFKLQNPTQDEAHRLVYMIEGSLLSMDVLELQIEAVIKVVDYFIIYYTRNPTNIKDLKTLKYRLKQMLPARNYLLYHCKLPSLNANCSSAEAYRIFRQQQLLTNAIKPTDIFIYTDDRVILGHRALNFLKYYGSSIPVVEFRLKFNVYGFYWQHPQLTKLNGVISSFQHVDNLNSDPSHLAQSSTSSALSQQKNSFVIGDLNHFGGWFCKYCQQPDEIVNELELFQSSSVMNSSGASSTNIIGYSSFAPTPSSRSIQNAVHLPTDKKHSLHIDSAYVQQVISVGLYLNDGKTQLLKVRRYTDKYFAPRYAIQESWKFGHLLVNIYESLEDDNEEEMF